MTRTAKVRRWTCELGFGINKLGQLKEANAETLRALSPWTLSIDLDLKVDRLNVGRGVLASWSVIFAFLDSWHGWLSSSFFFPFPLLRGEPQSETVIRVTANATSRWMQSDVSTSLLPIPARAHSHRLP